jgi:hypothetical protein
MDFVELALGPPLKAESEARGPAAHRDARLPSCSVSPDCSLSSPARDATGRWLASFKIRWPWSAHRAPDEEHVMRKLRLTLTAVLAVMGATIAGHSDAAVINPGALRTAANELTAVQTVQFFWRGRRYCWYDAGWRGPGWYWCGYRWRRGFGWGGPIGWRGWHRPGIHRRPGINRPGINRPGINRPGINRPGINRPGINRPGGNRPNINRPGGNRPGVNRPGGNRPGGRPGGNRRGGNRGRGRS